MTFRPLRVLLLLAMSLLPLQSGMQSHAEAGSPAETQPTYRDGELLVRFKAGASARAAKVHANARTQSIGRFGRLEHVRLAAGMDVAGMQRWYASQPDVEYAEPNYIVRKSAVPDDPHFNLQWGMRNTGQIVEGIAGTAGADINAADAWDRHTGNGTVVVAVVDTGIDYVHPDLAPNIWANPGEIAGDSVDNDGNSKVDDIRGWDFANNDADPMDDDVDSHGSHVAGIIGAAGNNGLGVSGINRNIKLMPLKVLRADGLGDIANIVAAIDYAIAKGVAVINASYAFDCGTAPSQSERDALDRARTAGILVVLAAGNDGCDSDTQPTYPASHALNNILSVGASDQFDVRAQFRTSSSNFGAQSVHLFAPGKNVYSTLRGISGNYLNSYGDESGTSMAAPHVSGSAALLKSYRPTLNMFEVREILLKTSDAKAALAGLAVTGGRLNIGAAMDYNLATSTPMQPSHLAASKVNDSRIDLSWLDDSTVETGWKLEYRSDPNSISFVSRATLAAATLSYQDSAVLAAEGTYHGYRVRATNSIGDSAPSAEVKVITPPLAPDNLQASGSGTTLSVSWSDRSARETSYHLERAITGQLFSEIASLPANTTQFEDSGLTIGTEYRYRARAHSGTAGYSDPIRQRYGDRHTA
jgi:serine protease